MTAGWPARRNILGGAAAVIAAAAPLAVFTQSGWAQGGPTRLRVGSIAELRQVPASGVAEIIAGERAGVFHWVAGDCSTDVAADPLAGVIVTTTHDPIGRRGAWRRQWQGGLRPEWFGAIGDGVSNDDAALVAVAQWGRSRGSLELALSAGRTYTHSHPTFLAGVRHLTVHGNGAGLMNIAGGTIDRTFLANYEGLGFPAIFSSHGHHNYEGSRTPQVFGNLIATAARGARAVRLTTHDVAVTVGARVLIYGFDGLGAPDGYPPCPKVFESHVVADVAGDVVHLSQPLRYNYDARWPDMGTSVPVGRPRLLPADRGDFTQIEQLEIRDLVIRAYPGWVAPGGNSERNGRLTLSGYDRARLETVTIAGGLYVSQGDSAEIVDCRIASLVETDKCLRRVAYTNTAMDSHILGNGTREIAFSNCTITKALVANPIETLTIAGGTIGGNGGQRGALMGFYGGVQQIRITGTRFLCSDPAKEALLGLVTPTVVVHGVAAGALMIGVDDYLKSLLCRCLHEGCTLYDDSGAPAFQVAALPYADGAMMRVAGTALVDIKRGDRLSQSYLGHVAIDAVRLEGPYAAQVMTVPSDFVPPPAGFEIVDADRGNNRWRLRSSQLPKLAEWRYLHLGAKIVPESLTISVTRARRGVGPTPLLRVRGYQSDDLAVIDLGQEGQRVIGRADVRGVVGADRLAALGERRLTTVALLMEHAGASGGGGGGEWSMEIAGAGAPRP